MPLTPLHLVVGLHARCGIKLMRAFIFANTLIDYEPGLILIFGWVLKGNSGQISKAGKVLLSLSVKE